MIRLSWRRGLTCAAILFCVANAFAAGAERQAIFHKHGVFDNEDSGGSCSA